MDSIQEVETTARGNFKNIVGKFQSKEELKF